MNLSVLVCSKYTKHVRSYGIRLDGHLSKADKNMFRFLCRSLLRAISSRALLQSFCWSPASENFGSTTHTHTMAEIEDAIGAPPTVTTTESEGTTTDDDVHLSPTCTCGGAGGAAGGGGVVGGGRIKILCSFGGRIVPRPHDGVLKYVGGETRVLAVPRSICFRELKKKVEDMFRTEVAGIKYQLLSLAEELDVLVSVTCDEDLVHMLDEYDRLEAKRSPTTSPRFRVYVFTPQAAAAAPALPSSARYAGLSRLHPHHHHQQHHHHHQQHHHFQAEERYVATVPASPDGSPPFSAQTHGAVSAGNSPRAAAEPPTVFGFGMQRVRSSPNLSSTLDAAAQRLHQHGVDGGGGGYVSGSPRHAAAAGPMLLQNGFHHYQQHQYPPAPAPAPVPVPHHGGRYDARGGYVRVGNYMAPAMVPAAAARPMSRGGPPPHSEMVTPKKSAIVWD